jgi:hypothetical protein
MSKGNTFENQILEHILNNANVALVGDATGLRGSTTAGSLYLALHTADPGEAGDQTTSETAYTSYARVACARDGTVWTVTNNSAALAAAKDFPACTASPGGDITHISLGTASSGAGKILYKGALTPNIAMAVGRIPRLGTGTTITED